MSSRSGSSTVIDDQVNPQIAAHGGAARLAAIEGSIAYVELSGGCQGCGSAKATLQQGIEVIILDLVPEITEVVDVTDHASGAQPLRLSRSAALSPDTTSGNAARNASTSSSVELQPTLARSERSASTPIAASTGDGSSASLEHDEPLCTATPRRSRPSRIGSASTPSTPEAHEVGERGAGIARPVGGAEAGDAVDGERTRGETVGERTSPRSASAGDRRRQLGGRGAEAHDRGHVLDAAAPRPLLGAAHENGGKRRPRRTSSAAAPLGPPNLCAVTDTRSAPSAAKSTGTWPAAAHASTCTVMPRSRAAATTAAAGCSVPTSWLASCTVTSVVSSRHRGEHRGGVVAAEAVDADLGDRARAAARDRFEHRGVLDRGGDDVPAAGARAARRTPRCSPTRCPTR